MPSKKDKRKSPSKRDTLPKKSPPRQNINSSASGVSTSETPTIRWTSPRFQRKQNDQKQNAHHDKNGTPGKSVIAFGPNEQQSPPPNPNPPGNKQPGNTPKSNKNTNQVHTSTVFTGSTVDKPEDYSANTPGKDVIDTTGDNVESTPPAKTSPKIADPSPVNKDDNLRDCRNVRVTVNNTMLPFLYPLHLNKEGKIVCSITDTNHNVWDTQMHAKIMMTFLDNPYKRSLSEDNVGNRYPGEDMEVLLVPPPGNGNDNSSVGDNGAADKVCQTLHLFSHPLDHSLNIFVYVYNIFLTILCCTETCIP